MGRRKGSSLAESLAFYKSVAEAIRDDEFLKPLIGDFVNNTIAHYSSLVKPKKNYYPKKKSRKIRRGPYCVYVIHEDYYDLVKIGFSRSPFTRLRILNEETRGNCKLCARFKFTNKQDAIKFEEKAHRVLRWHRTKYPKRICGYTEFFKISPDKCISMLTMNYAKYMDIDLNKLDEHVIVEKGIFKC